MRRWRTCCETQWGGGLIWWMLMLEDEAPWSGQSLLRTLGRDWFCVLPHRSPWTWVSLYRLSDLVAGPLFKRVGRAGLILDLVVPRQLLPACPPSCQVSLPLLPPGCLHLHLSPQCLSIFFFSREIWCYLEPWRLRKPSCGWELHCNNAQFKAQRQLPWHITY